MTADPSSPELETARARLEAALSGLAQGVATTREALGTARIMADEKAQVAERVAKLESENLRLHEQIATFALQTPSADTDAQLTTLKQDKAALEQNYKILKAKYTDLQEAAEQSALKKSTPVQIDLGVQMQINQLKREKNRLNSEKNMIKAELDKAIADLESLTGGV